jgi:hypothetical protein
VKLNHLAVVGILRTKYLNVVRVFPVFFQELEAEQMGISLPEILVEKLSNQTP